MKTSGKTLTAITIFLLSTGSLFAQENIREEMTIPLSTPGQSGKLECGLVNGSIKVTGYTGNEVQVVATQPMKKISVKKETEGPEKEGLKKISSSSFNITAEENDNVVRIRSQSVLSTINLEINVPAKFDLKLNTVNNGDITVEGVEGNLEVANVNGSVTLTNVSGSVVTNTVNGEVKVNMNRVDAGIPMSFASFNGDVDVTLPGSVKATTRMNSTMGDIYTDFDVEFQPKRTKADNSEEGGVYKISVDEFISGKLNGGGPEFVFKSFSGDIYLRKK
jgi:hypothetical protein